ncbi:uncharacterized protein Dmul_18070 [Desulfococcus multivorans]|nr:uncharacterized protein Dmul_18070 [Desulfococcus multivorans]
MHMKSGVPIPLLSSGPLHRYHESRRLRYYIIFWILSDAIQRYRYPEYVDTVFERDVVPAGICDFFETGGFSRLMRRT